MKKPKSQVSATSARRAIFLGIAVFAVFLDQLTKELAIANLSPGNVVEVIGELIRFRLTYNDSAAFSLGVGATWVLAIISSVAVLALLWFGPRAKNLTWSIIAGLVLGGAAGNLVDRITREPGFLNGHVVDFIQIPFNFPIFNLADSFLVIGVGLAMLRTLMGDEIGGKDGK
ncbi:MAG: signal peptidase [Actinomycetota bacterium]|jgi:signal peptidase II